MANKSTLKVQARENGGKGIVKSIRANKMLPGVIYGNKKAPVLIQMDPRDLEKEWKVPGFKTRQFEIEVEGGEKELAFCHDIQFGKTTDAPMHVDFLRIDLNKEVKIAVPVKFENADTCAGVKAGGVLNIVRRELEVVCAASKIPSEIVVDIKDLNVAESLHCGDIKLPAGVKLSSADKFTVATISAPIAEEAPAEEAPAAEATEEASAE
ncbi:MAG: 50S ribosomal protein L25/general stress protein Ctc [Alphaproteobacteria bacterium]|nr:50S ribosomal protein L25/general stress protein Ctc [Alphaproteobacteria bacterium]